MFDATDHAFMARALALAARATTAAPNPGVGCVIVRAGRIVGEGWSHAPGGAHAEVEALRAAGAATAGATVYVTLEPCAHFGRTPPCSSALVAARVARVAAALEDPNPQVAGKGFAELRAAGVAVDVGLMADAARLVHRGFLSRITRGRPWVRLKVGASFDGRTALAGGASRWITGPDARRDVHALRARSCAVLTGIGTVLADDPQLTVRDVPCARQPLRVVVDSRLEIGDAAQVLQGGAVLLVTATGPEERAAHWRGRGVEVLRVPVDAAKGKVDLVAMMRALGARGLNDVLVETGAKLNGSLLAAGVVDEIVAYVAPAILGDSARGMFAIGELKGLENRMDIGFTEVRQVGADLRVTARVGRA